MSQLLDLCITVEQPPEGAPADAIGSIDLRCDELGLSHSGDLLKDPLTQKERDELRWYLEEYWRWWPYYSERGRQVEGLLIELGERIYKTTFGSIEARDILQTWRLQPGVQRQISIMSNIPAVLSLPWELLHDEHGFLTLRSRNPISIKRRLQLRDVIAYPTDFEPPLRVLLVTARPDDAAFVDPRSIARELVYEVQSQAEKGAIELEFLRPPTLSALRARLSDSRRPPVHVIHFDGHGTFESETTLQDESLLRGGEQGMLAFENELGKLELVRAEHVAQVLVDSGVRLVVLTACQSAMSRADDAFSSIAARLIQGGIDAVVAMSASVLIASAARYAKAFYGALASGIPVPIAHERARQALHDNPTRQIKRRRRDGEGAPVKLYDWWLPHFYQQRSLTLEPTKPVSKHKRRKSSTPIPRLNDDMLKEPRYGFIGRSRELLHIERLLLQQKLVVISGFGGIGKSALAREAADWLTQTGMFNGACFVSFEHGGDEVGLLRKIGKYLGIDDSSYDPNDQTAGLARLKPALEKRPILVIADNLESILPGVEAPLEVIPPTQLWDVLLKLVTMRAGILLTSRTTSFGDGRLAAGNKVTHLILEGLQLEDAFALATRLLDNLEIDRKRVPYAELRDLLKQLDNHPLAIQLVLPVLQTLPISRVRSDFTALLDKFADNTEVGHNKSLLASLEYSFQRLSKEQRMLLRHLAIFEGGVYEVPMLKITEFPESEWYVLRSAMEQEALLTVEQANQNVLGPFLHFHPVLSPYLRRQPIVNEDTLYKKYATYYYLLPSHFDSFYKKDPWFLREMVLHELPNLRRTLKLLLEEGERASASIMLEYMAPFLRRFGLGREYNELEKWKEQASPIPDRTGLTKAQYLYEVTRGEEEFVKGNLYAASIWFLALLERIKVQPQGTSLGPGTYVYCQTLGWLARCLCESGHPLEAERQLREALTTIGALLVQQPENRDFISLQGTLLIDLGDALTILGQYASAWAAYEKAEGFKHGDTQGLDVQGLFTALGQHSLLPLKQYDYDSAWKMLSYAREVSHLLPALATRSLVSGATCSSLASIPWLETACSRGYRMPV